MKLLKGKIFCTPLKEKHTEWRGSPLEERFCNDEVVQMEVKTTGENMDRIRRTNKGDILIIKKDTPHKFIPFTDEQIGDGFIVDEKSFIAKLIT